METYEHSVTLDTDKCTGCTNCMHHCPTEAIRIKQKHAVINEKRCIDCGECIRNCPQHAQKAYSSKLESMERFKYKIAIPSPVLYGQFENLDDIDYVLDGLIKLGFDDVYEEAKAAEIVTSYTRQYMKEQTTIRPVISSACPAVTRLIYMMYPSLTENVMRLRTPAEIAAREARKRAKEQHPELSDEEIGVCYISPCAAMVSFVKSYNERLDLKIDEVVSVRDIYFKLIGIMKHGTDIRSLSDAGMIGVAWAADGGESSAILNDNYLAADGITHVIRVLSQIEDENIPPVQFIELRACPAGCVGGVLNVQNPFIAKARLQTIRRYLPVSLNHLTPEQSKVIPEDYVRGDLPECDQINRLSDDISESMRMMLDIQKLKEQLPGIDCGVCGAPTCRAHAEDIVRNGGNQINCPIMN